MNLSGLASASAAPARCRPALRRIPGIGADTWTADEPGGGRRCRCSTRSTSAATSTATPVQLTLAYRNLLCGGVADSGKSNGAAQVIAHAALCPDVRMWFFDGKWVELGFWQPLAERFIGPVLPDAIDTADRAVPAAGRAVRVAAVDRPAQAHPGRVGRLGPGRGGRAVPVHRDLRRHRPSRRSSPGCCGTSSPAAGPPCMPVVASAQRPSSDIVPTSLRDLFAWRWAFRCTTPDSSDVVLYSGSATAGYDASQLDPDAAGVGYLLAHGGAPRRIEVGLPVRRRHRQHRPRRPAPAEHSR